MLKSLGNFLSKTLPHYIQFITFRQKELHLDLYSHVNLKQVLFIHEHNITSERENYGSHWGYCLTNFNSS